MQHICSKKIINLIILLCFALFMTQYSQVKSNSKQNFMTNKLVVKFKKPIIDIPQGEKYGDLTNIISSKNNLKSYFKNFDGEITFEKLIPNAVPDDTLRITQMGKIIKLNNWSQVFTIKLPKSVSFSKIKSEIKQLVDVEYIELPVQIKDDLSTNDPYFGDQWYLNKINAESAWNISKGNNVRLAIIESGGCGQHEDINYALNEGGNSSDHGIMVSGVAGAITDNSKGISGNGWNIEIVGMNGGNSTSFVQDIRNSADPSLQYKAEIINCSFKTIYKNDDGTYFSYNSSTVENAINDAQAFGAVVVASAGNPPETNDLDTVPYQQWPAAYDGVIAVSATNSNDQFPTGYNYGTHVDVSAPAINIFTTGNNDSYISVNGTSFSAPLTASTVGLILSLDKSLANVVDDIIQNSATDLGVSGRDDYFGYGRINSHNALKEVFNNYDVTLEGNYTFYETII